tara:strand:- start:2059 stop:2313 length:255 start_codon:yes stop_codon:yes gene_type:complete
MFPYPHHRPAHSPELSGLLKITPPVPLSLFSPPDRVGLWDLEMPRATMPEAAVYENYEVVTPEDKICICFHLRDRDVLAVSESQ